MTSFGDRTLIDVPRSEHLRTLSLLGPSACCPSCPSVSLFPPSAESSLPSQAVKRPGTHALGMGISQQQISY